MTDPGNPAAPWTGSPSAKEKNALQKEIVALLDELAPEKVLTRGDRLRLPVEQHRTPSGCVLQADKAAITVSWFAPGGSETALGELHILVWRGVVSRRGSPPKKEGAAVVMEQVVYPIGRPATPKVWRTETGEELTTPEVAVMCLALLKEQTDAAEPDE